MASLLVWCSPSLSNDFGALRWYAFAAENSVILFGRDTGLFIFVEHNVCAVIVRLFFGVLHTILYGYTIALVCCRGVVAKTISYRAAELLPWGCKQEKEFLFDAHLFFILL